MPPNVTRRLKSLKPILRKETDFKQLEAERLGGIARKGKQKHIYWDSDVKDNEGKFKPRSKARIPVKKTQNAALVLIAQRASGVQKVDDWGLYMRSFSQEGQRYRAPSPHPNSRKPNSSLSHDITPVITASESSKAGSSRYMEQHSQPSFKKAKSAYLEVPRAQVSGRSSKSSTPTSASSTAPRQVTKTTSTRDLRSGSILTPVKPSELPSKLRTVVRQPSKSQLARKNPESKMPQSLQILPPTQIKAPKQTVPKTVANQPSNSQLSRKSSMAKLSETLQIFKPTQIKPQKRDQGKNRPKFMVKISDPLRDTESSREFQATANARVEMDSDFAAQQKTYNYASVPPAVPDPPVSEWLRKPPPAPRPARLPTPDLPEIEGSYFPDLDQGYRSRGQSTWNMNENAREIKMKAQRKASYTSLLKYANNWGSPRCMGIYSGDEDDERVVTIAVV
jgi:hypothetical protein